MEHGKLLELTADIVAAHVSHNNLDAAALPELIAATYAALEGAAHPAPPVEERPTPAVPIRSSLKADAIRCLECGTSHKMLKRHLGTAHGMTPDEYRARWELPATYPMVAPDYAEVRRSLAKSIGLGRHPNAGRGRKPGAAAAARARA